MISITVWLPKHTPLIKYAPSFSTEWVQAKFNPDPVVTKTNKKKNTRVYVYVLTKNFKLEQIFLN